MGMGYRVEMPGAEQTARRWRRVPRAVRDQWEDVLTRETERGVRRIQVRYRSAPHTTPMATKVVTGNLRASYGADVRREGGGVTAEMGGLHKFEHGKALVYMPVHEFGAKIRGRHGHVFTVLARPPGGAIEAARRYIMPRIMRDLRRTGVEVIRGQRR